mgnify:CR=1 FL=1
MANRTANYCRIDYVVDSVELKEGKKGPWCVVQGHYEAQDRDGYGLEVKIRSTAFGTIADRFGQVQAGEMVRAEFELGAWKSDKGYVNPEYVCTSISRPWPSQAARGARTDGMKPERAAPAPQQQQEDDSLPFGWLILVPLLGLGASLAGAGVVA